jgi:hypothetical protein
VNEGATPFASGVATLLLHISAATPLVVAFLENPYLVFRMTDEVDRFIGLPDGRFRQDRQGTNAHGKEEYIFHNGDLLWAV